MYWMLNFFFIKFKFIQSSQPLNVPFNSYIDKIALLFLIHYFFLFHPFYKISRDLTSKTVCNDIKEALSEGQEKHFEILYYKKNGEFKHMLFFSYSCRCHLQSRYRSSEKRNHMRVSCIQILWHHHKNDFSTTRRENVLQ